MEGLSLSKDIIALITGIGVIPTLIIVALCFYFFYREIKKKLSSMEDQIKTLAAQVKDMDKEFVPKEQYYRDFEGWKNEVRDMRKDLHSFQIEITKELNKAGPK